MLYTVLCFWEKYCWFSITRLLYFLEGFLCLRHNKEASTALLKSRITLQSVCSEKRTVISASNFVLPNVLLQWCFSGRNIIFIFSSNRPSRPVTYSKQNIFMCLEVFLLKLYLFCVDVKLFLTPQRENINWCWGEYLVLRYMESGGRTSHIPNPSTRWSWVISFMLQPLYSFGKSPQYPLDKRLGGTQSCSWFGGKEKKSLPLQGIETWLSIP